MSPEKGLQKAEIYEVKKNGSKGDSLSCMFNPSEYSISKSNQYTETPNKKENGPHSDLFKMGARTLKLNLWFDTYEESTDVNDETKTLWQFMERGDGDEPTRVAFEWSVFRFEAYITNLSQQYTLFTQNGMPVRAKVDISFTEYFEKKLPPQNPTSGGGPPDRIWKVTDGDRLDLIAYEVYSDATEWRRIAERNHITNPLRLRAGQLLEIPKD